MFGVIVCVWAGVGVIYILANVVGERRAEAAARAEAEAGFFGSASVSISMRPHAGASRERLEEYRRGIQQQVDAVMEERWAEAANWERERERALARVRRTRERLRARRDIDAMII